MYERPLSHKIAFCFLLLVIIVLLTSLFVKGPFNPKNIPGKNTIFPDINFISSYNFDFQNTQLDTIVQNRLQGQSGNYAIYIENLVTKEKYGYHQNDSFPSASLYKLFLMAAVMDKVQNGNLQLSDTITNTKSHLTDVYGEVDYGYEDSDENISYTVDEAMQRVGRISDNFAAIMLAENVGWDNVQAAANKIGATQTTIKDPIQTSASDIGLFFNKLYNNQIVSPTASQQISDYLSLNLINDRIPAKLPEGIKIVHKTGELSLVRHDAGIVYCCTTQSDASPSATPSNPYVIVMLSKDLQYEDDAVDLMANISADVYQYFKNK